MATIGAFTQAQDGSYAGSIKTLSLNVRVAQLRPTEKTDDKAPDYRIFSGQTEFGAAWKRTSKEDRDRPRPRERSRPGASRSRWRT